MRVQKVVTSFTHVFPLNGEWRTIVGVEHPEGVRVSNWSVRRNGMLPAHLPTWVAVA